MTKNLFIAVAMCLLMCTAAAAASGQNPFTGKKEAPASPTGPRLFSSNAFLSKIALWQHRVRDKMAELVAQAKQERSLRPLALLLVLAFSYGVLHAAGPGHGKAVAFSYIITQQPHFGRALLFGVSVALIHGLAGISFVLMVGVVLKIGAASAMGEMTYFTQVISYSLIVLIGFVIIARAVVEWRGHRRHAHGGAHPKPPGNPWAAAFAIGLVPCPGVIMVALFSVSMGLIGLGVILGLAISLGMALTISLVIMIAVAGKKVAVHRLAGHGNRLAVLDTAFESVGGLLVVTLGLIFLSASL